MTYASIPALRMQPELAARWEPLITTLDYDPGLRPAASKRGALVPVTLAHGRGSMDVLAVSQLSPSLLDGLALSRIRTAWRGSPWPSPPSRDWPSAGRPTKGSAYPPVLRRPARRPIR